MSFGNVLSLYNKALKYPYGKTLFSLSFCMAAPYFLTIFPAVDELKPGLAKVSLQQSWIKQNHIKTVHAIAVCNLVEMAMGLVAEASLPSHLRWLPMGMNVDYLKKATGTLTATSSIDPAKHFLLDKYPGQVLIPVVVTNSEGAVVTKADVKLWISEKPAKNLPHTTSQPFAAKVGHMKALLRKKSSNKATTWS